MSCCPDYPDPIVNVEWQSRRKRKDHEEPHDPGTPATFTWGDWGEWGVGEEMGGADGLIDPGAPGGTFPAVGVFTNSDPNGHDVPTSQESRFRLYFQPPASCRLRMTIHLIWYTIWQYPYNYGADEAHFDHAEDLPEIEWSMSGTRTAPCIPGGFDNADESTWPRKPEGTADDWTDAIVIPAPPLDGAPLQLQFFGYSHYSIART